MRRLPAGRAAAARPPSQARSWRAPWPAVDPRLMSHATELARLAGRRGSRRAASRRRVDARHWGDRRRPLGHPIGAHRVRPRHAPSLREARGRRRMRLWAAKRAPAPRRPAHRRGARSSPASGAVGGWRRDAAWGTSGLDAVRVSGSSSQEPELRAVADGGGSVRAGARGSVSCCRERRCRQADLAPRSPVAPRRRSVRRRCRWAWGPPATCRRSPPGRAAWSGRWRR